MSYPHNPFLDQLRDEFYRAAITDTDASRRDRRNRGIVVGLPRLPAGSVALLAAVVVTIAVVVVVLRGHSQAPKRSMPAFSAASLSSALGPESPGFTGVAPVSARAALEHAATAAAAGSATPPLKSGQAWYSSARALISSQLFSGADGQHARPAIQASVLEVEKWFPAQGLERSVSVSLSPLLTGSTWGGGSPSDAAGFGDWDALPNFKATAGPTTALHALTHGTAGFLGYPKNNRSVADQNSSAFTILARAAAILGDEPVTPAAREAVLRTLARLPHLGYLEHVRDPLGRAGVAITATTSNIKAFAHAGPQSYQLELIFNPSTGTVLGDRTIATIPIPALHVHAGQVLFSWAYRLTRLVSTATIRSPRQLYGAMNNDTRRVAAQRRHLQAPGGACHPAPPATAQATTGATPASQLTNRCAGSLRALAARARALALRDPAVLRAARALLTPPPAVR